MNEENPRADRREQLLDVMERAGVGTLMMRRPANFAWYTGGADNRVDHSDPLGVASMLLTPDAEYVLTDNIEAPRMRQEQTPEFEVVEHPWHEDFEQTLAELAGDGAVGVDFSHEGYVDVEAGISTLRYRLDAGAIERYRRLGVDAAGCVAETVRVLDPGMTELEATARLVAACREREIFTPVLVAASGERMNLYRHPVPPGSTGLGSRAMLVVCAERGGLFANLTRIAYFEEPDPETVRRQRACKEILHRMREEATRPGRTLAEAFDDCRRFYAEAGFPGGWRHHHQGGLTGYASREIVATPNSSEQIQSHQAFAWNPSLEGAKAEETFVLTEDGAEVLTRL